MKIHNKKSKEGKDDSIEPRPGKEVEAKARWSKNRVWNKKPTYKFSKKQVCKSKLVKVKRQKSKKARKHGKWD